MRALFIIVCALVAGAASVLGQPLVEDNSDAVTVMITVITVFAGFLVAIIAVLGDPAMIPKGSWRKAEANHGQLELHLMRHTSLFYCYLLAIACLFAGVLIQKEPSTVVTDVVRRWVQYAYLFFATFSFLLTLSLPRTLARLQLARSAAEIEERRGSEGIVSSSSPKR
jgi:hypothetical protein